VGESWKGRGAKRAIRVLVVDDHFVVRKGVCALLSGAEGIVVAGEAADGEQAIAEARRLRPRVILMDLKLPGLGGVAAIRTILAELPETAVVAFTGSDDDEVLAAVEEGALGYLAKTSPRGDFVDAIRRVAQGDAWLPLRLTHRLVARLKLRQKGERVPQEPLTARERQVLAMLARGWSNRRISQELEIKEITVRTHVSHVLGKLGVHNRLKAALHAVRLDRAGLPDS
jgi:DNA-binding NarL/FixJ family response regulator